jgi:hypothetical protein
MPIGKWLDLKGYDMKPHGSRATPAAADAKTPPPQVKPEKPPKEEKAPPPPFEPWLDTLKGEFKPIKVRCRPNVMLGLPLPCLKLRGSSCTAVHLRMAAVSEVHVFLFKNCARAMHV